MRPLLATSTIFIVMSCSLDRMDAGTDPTLGSDAIRARYARMDALFAADSMEAIASIYHDSASIVSYNRMITGRDAIRAYWGMLAGTGVSWEHRIQALEVRGDRAVQYGTSQLCYRSGEDTLTSLVRYTLIWHRDDAGIWWIHRDHYTPMARAVMEE